MNKVQISKDLAAIRLKEKAANSTLDNLRAARRIVETVTQAPVDSMTGEQELETMLKIGSYPRAPLMTLADLNGIGREFMQYRELISKLEDLERFELVDGEPRIKDSWLDEINEQHTTYVEGEQAKQYLEAQAIADAWNKLQAKMAAPLDRIMQIQPYNKEMVINAMQFMYSSQRL